MSDQTPYEVWIVETTGREFPLVGVVGAQGLDDSAVIALAQQQLQDIIDAIDENPSLLDVRTDIILPVARNIRIGRRREELGN